jgi:hypothetical protein
MVVKWTISLRIKTFIKKTYRFAACVLECPPLHVDCSGAVVRCGAGDGWKDVVWCNFRVDFGFGLVGLAVLIGGGCDVV